MEGITLIILCLTLSIFGIYLTITDKNRYKNRFTNLVSNLILSGFCVVLITMIFCLIGKMFLSL